MVYSVATLDVSSADCWFEPAGVTPWNDSGKAVRTNLFVSVVKSRVSYPASWTQVLLSTPPISTCDLRTWPQAFTLSLKVTEIVCQVLYISMHWSIFVQNIGGQTQIFVKNVVKTDKCMAFLDLFGGARPGCPQSLRLCEHGYTNLRLLLNRFRFVRFLW